MQVGCYDLHVYCSNSPQATGEEREEGVECAAIEQGSYKGFMCEVTGHNQREAISNAKKLGFKVGRAGEPDFCPHCVKAGRTR